MKIDKELLKGSTTMLILNLLKKKICMDIK